MRKPRPASNGGRDDLVPARGRALTPGAPDPTSPPEAYRVGIGSRAPNALLTLAGALVTAVAVATVWAVPIPPFTDYPNWLAQAVVFGDPSAFPGHELAFAPNGGSTAVVWGLSWLMPVEWAGRFALAAAIAGLPAAAWLVGRVCHGQARPGWVVGVILCQHLFVLQGMLSFALALPVALIGLATLWYAWPRRVWAPWIALAGIATATAIGHASAFAILVIGAAATSALWREWRSVGRAWVALAPGVALLVVYAVTRPDPGGPWLVLPTSPWRWASDLGTSVLPVAVFDPISHPLPTSLVSLAALLSLASIALGGLRRPRWPRSGRWRAAVGTGIALLVCGAVLPARFLEVVAPGQRLWLAGVVVVLVAMAPRLTARWPHWLALAVAAVVMITNFVGATAAQAAVADARRAALHLPADPVVLVDPLSRVDTDVLHRLAVRVQPLRHAHAWQTLDVGTGSCALFQTGWVRRPTCPAPPYPVARGRDVAEVAASARAAAAAMNTRTVLITGSPASLDALAEALAVRRGGSRYMLVAELGPPGEVDARP